MDLLARAGHTAEIEGLVVWGMATLAVGWHVAGGRAATGRIIRHLALAVVALGLDLGGVWLALSAMFAHQDWPDAAQTAVWYGLLAAGAMAPVLGVLAPGYALAAVLRACGRRP